MIAVIMAGGKGTRLQNVSREIPKPMIPVCGKPVLEHQINSLKRCNIDEIIIIIGYLGNKISEYFKDGKDYGVKITYIEENVPLGTAGALFYLKSTIKEDFFLVFGDLMINIDWNKMYLFHKENNSKITLFAHPNSHPYDSDLLILDHNSRVIKVEAKNEVREFYYKNVVNAGIYILSPSVLDGIAEPVKMDFEKDILIKELHNSNVFAYCSPEYVKDMGTVDRLELVTSDLTHGIIEQKNLLNKQKCIFLDRDGTINKWVGLLRNKEDLALLDGVTEAIKLINQSKYLCIVITNQPVIARGDITMEELNDIHNKLETILGLEGAYIDDLFYCPHHPDSGYEGEIKDLKIACNCRKPNIGMLEDASYKYNIDLNNSWFIGDTSVDIQTGINAGCKTVLVLSGEKEINKKYICNPDYIFEDLNKAVQDILSHEEY